MTRQECIDEAVRRGHSFRLRAKWLGEHVTQIKLEWDRDDELLAKSPHIVSNIRRIYRELAAANGIT